MIQTAPASGPNRIRRLRLVSRWAGVVALTLCVGTALGWAAAVVVVAPQNELPDDEVYYTAADGEVSSSIAVNIDARWPAAFDGVNLTSGTVTTIAQSSAEVTNAGTVLYTVNLRPVSIAIGAVPSFRTLASGSTGQDVAQLQTLLASLGHYKGASDSKFDSRTASAVRDWQRANGVSPTGVVEASDIIYVPALPARVTINTESIRVGSVLGGGETAIHVLADRPAFTVNTSADQARILVDGMTVSIEGPAGQDWKGELRGRTELSDGSISLIVEGTDGAAICGDECQTIPVDSQSTLSASVIRVESTTGVVIPVTAISSDASGSTSVTLINGSSQDVEILASANGLAVISGIDSGERLLLIGTKASP